VTSAVLDRLLAVLVVALAATGIVSLRMGAPGDGWLFAIHGVLGGALAIAVGWKIGHSMPRAVRARRWGRVALGLLVSIATVAALVGGFAWVAGGQLLSIGSWTILTIHAWIGLALVPLVLVHLLPRRWRLLVPGARGRRTTRVTAPTRVMRGVSRRQLMIGGGLSIASLTVFGAAQVADRITGGVRRFTGSRWLPAGVPPPTTFFGEGAPDLDPARWRLRVHGNVAREIELSIDAMTALGEVDRTAVLDCTSGWAMAASWRGVPLRAVLDVAGAAGDMRSVLVRSTTGWATSLGRADVDRALLATGVADRPLPVGNGAPCRLVVPDRRGLDWVKWVAEVEVV
jgi:DMSO/TMAO reductase YedYZ molybdopterin-dependent catalytic subunit